MLLPKFGVVVLDPIPVAVVSAPRVVVQQRGLQLRRMSQRGLPGLPGRSPEHLTQVSQVVPNLGHFGRIVAHPLVVLRVDEQGPEHVLLHGAALAALVLETVGGHHIGPDGGQVFRRFNGGAHLRDRRIRTAHRTDTAVAPGLAADPVTDVGPIAPGMGRGRVVVHPGGLRPVTVAQVDQHHVVALGHKIVSDFAVAPLGLVIGRMQHDRREAALDKGAVLRGPVDVKCQAHAVAHGHHDILGEVDTVGTHEVA